MNDQPYFGVPGNLRFESAGIICLFLIMHDIEMCHCKINIPIAALWLIVITITFFSLVLKSNCKMDY